MILVIVLVVAAVIGAAVVFSAYESRRIEASNQPVGRFVTLNGRRIHYVDLLPDVPDGPDTPALVFVHGASGNLNDPMMALRPGLEGRHRLVFVDRPGHGYSDALGAEDADPRAQADILDALLARIGVNRAVIIGHSWGGSVTAAFALRHPTRTAGLVFLAAATHPWPGGVDWYYDLAATPVIGPLFARTAVMPIGVLLTDGSVNGVFAPNPVPPDYLNRSETRLLFRPDAFVANAREVAGLKGAVTEMAPHYGDIAAPTVVISGDKDGVVWEELHSAGLARDIPGARLIWLPGVGHMPHHAATDTVIAAIEEVANLARGHALASAE